MERFRRLDFNIKGVEGIQEKTAVGGLGEDKHLWFTVISLLVLRWMIDEVTVVSASVCLLLLISELLAFMRVEVINHMTVDSTPSMGLVPINFDITFPLVDCKDISFEAESIRGDTAVAITEDDIKKERAGPHQEGCTVKGIIHTSKVAGEFRINLGSATAVPVATLVESMDATNKTRHKINHFSFGERVTGSVYPMDGIETVPNGEGHYMYNVRIIPTVYKKLGQQPHYSYEISFQESLHRGLRVSPGMTAVNLDAPGVHFFYDFYPIMVEYAEKKASFLQFLTSVCAIVGGIFTVSTLIDSMIYRSTRAFKKLA